MSSSKTAGVGGSLPSAAGLQRRCQYLEQLLEMEISRRRRAEQELATVSRRLKSDGGRLPEGLSCGTEKWFAKAFHASPDLISIRKLADGRYVDVNATWLQVMGYRRSEVIGRTGVELGVVFQVECGVGRPGTGDGESFRDLDVSFRVRSGALRYGSASQVVINVDGELCVLTTVRDVTERRLLEKEMLHRERLNLVGGIAAGLAHEIRNPLTSVRGFLQLFGEKPELACDRHCLQLMIGELDRANAIITDFLLLAKDKPAVFQPVNLSRLAETLLPLLWAEALRTNKKVCAHLADVGDLLLDEYEIRQLILNLAQNGLEAMSPGGTLTISTAREGEDIILTVRDEGPGISPELIDRLGTPFLTTKEEGTGLGLSLCYCIAQRHNAQISVDTGTTGTTFKVRFCSGTGQALDDGFKGSQIQCIQPPPRAAYVGEGGAGRGQPEIP
jgi:PAS domain S-box-containing protein